MTEVFPICWLTGVEASKTATFLFQLAWASFSAFTRQQGLADGSRSKRRTTNIPSHSFTHVGSFQSVRLTLARSYARNRDEIEAGVFVNNYFNLLGP